MRPAPTLVVLCCTLALACSAPEPPIDLEAAKSALLEADRQWAASYLASETPADAFVEQMEENARLLPPEMPLAEGKQAIHGVIEHLASTPGMHIEWAPSSADVSSRADLGFTVGTYQMRFDGPEGQPLAIEGKYLTVWRKQADGSWKVTVDTFTPDAPPSPVAEEDETSG